MNEKYFIKENIKKLELKLAESIKYMSYVPAKPNSNFDLLQQWSRVNFNIFYTIIKLKDKLKNEM